jgi:ABC-type methionine transport system ATPase subunit
MITEKEIALSEVLHARQNVALARQNFNYATGSYVGAAIEALNIAERDYEKANQKLHEVCERIRNS